MNVLGTIVRIAVILFILHSLQALIGCAAEDTPPKDGQDGYSAVFEVVPAPTLCPNGGNAFIAALDANRDGVVSEGDLNLTTTAICNGIDGVQGPAGQDGVNGSDGKDAVAELIDPCGDAPGVVDEVLIKLADGRVLASFSANVQGLYTRLAVLPPGTYMTTDGSGCVFSIP